MKLYVGNLPYSYKDQDLRTLFSAYGNIASATIIIDRQTGRSKGFGFVEIEDDNLAQTAVSEMNEKDIDGRNIKVNEARPMTDKPRERFGGRDSGRSWDRR
ncbi:RNA-binding protein [candidate division WWE3 bacterium RBG_19FT_COMBO_34_6]|uniref:RNA-binding protein n=1 Tax=candidate division WWE3 bacterium RBG_19FT_COMBO_34_6 TaxID=1802612 RepID=A0A1F4UKX8_UNCKA|nr:MAG: RNA-binding protein [candidate division WWE3 bacterium RBG_19FT_COMBO_34_6]